MDRQYLNQMKAELQSFVNEINSSEHKLDYICLVPVLFNDFVLQVDAEWIRKGSRFDALSIINKYFFKTTAPETRMKIFAINTYKKSGQWQCPSEDFVLVGEMPLVLH